MNQCGGFFPSSKIYNVRPLLEVSRKVSYDHQMMIFSHFIYIKKENKE